MIAKFSWIFEYGNSVLVLGIMGTKIDNGLLNRVIIAGNCSNCSVFIVLNTQRDVVIYQHLPSIRYILMDAWIHFNGSD